MCCIASPEEMWLAVGAGAAAVGLVSQMPSGPGVISENAIAKIASQVPPGVDSFLLTCTQSAEQIIAQHGRCKTSVIQICDHLTNGSYDELRRALPGVRLVQVVHVVGEGSVAEAVSVAAHVDAVLLDSGRPKAAVKELGGTGRVHDWAISKKIREELGVPLFLAGGLKAENVANAIRQVGPFAVDVCSGVRTDGRLHAMKLKQFMHEVARISDDTTYPFAARETNPAAI